MKEFYRFASILILAFLFTECRDDETNPPDQDVVDDLTIQEYLSTNQLEAQKDAKGYYFIPLIENPDGREIAEGEVASVYYKVSLLDGKILEWRQPSNTAPLKFVHAWGGLAPEAINYGISRMKTGEKYRFIIPSKLAFGDFYSLGYFGSNEIISAEVELVKVESYAEHAASEKDTILKYIESKNIVQFTELPSGVHKYTIIPGNGQSPAAGEIVRVVLRRKYLNEQPAGKLVGAASDTVDLYLPVGKNDYVQGISRATDGLKEGLLQMNVGEEAVILTPSQLAFGGTLIDYGDSYGGAIQVVPQKFRDDFVQDYLKLQQNIYPLAVLKYEAKLLRIH